MKNTNSNNHYSAKIDSLIIVLIYFFTSIIWFIVTSLVIKEPTFFKQISIPIFIVLSTLFLYLLLYKKIKKYCDIISKINEINNNIEESNNSFYSIQEKLLKDLTDIDNILNSDLRLTITGRNDLAWDWDLTTNKYHFSSKWKALFGYKNLENNIETWKSLIHPNDLAKALITINNYLNHKVLSYQNIYRVKTQKGDYKWILSRGKAIWENGVAIRFSGTHTDITKHYELKKRLYHLAYFHSVTNLPNRAYMEIKVDNYLKNLQQNELFALVYIDIDNFKHINEIKGHNAGDALLKHIAIILTKFFKPPNIVGNIGIDDFLVGVTQVKNIQDVYNTVNFIHDNLRKTWQYNAQDFFITTSMGIAVYPHHGKNFQDLLISADLARNYAKEKGRDKFVYYNLSIREKAIKKIEITNALRNAITKEELILYFQPQIELKRNRVIAFEVLLRWNHPEKGLISPTEFIPIAESNGFIDQITDYVFEKACQQKIIWKKNGFENIRLTINISPISLMQNGLIIKLKKIFNKYKLSPNEFELEITETAVINDLERAVYNLKQLKSIGIRIALDDFGSGYSSLTYLQQLPIDVLKLDQKLIKTIHYEYEDAYILKMIIEIAHYLGLKIVAEGVETKEQLFIMMRHHCDYVQGFYYSKPLPANKIDEKVLYSSLDIGNN